MSSNIKKIFPRVFICGQNRKYGYRVNIMIFTSLFTSLSDLQKGALFAISSGLSYALVGYFGVMLMSEGLSVYNLTFWRSFIAFLFIGLFMIPRWKQLFQYYKESFLIVLYGMLFYSPSGMLYFVASTYIGTGLGMVLFYTFPVFVTIFNLFYYRNRPRISFILTLILMLWGMFCLVDPREIAFDIIGIAVGILAALIYAGYVFLSKITPAPALLSTFTVLGGSAITAFMTAKFDGSLCLPKTFSSWANIFGLSIFTTALPILLLLKALSYIRSEQASMLSVVEPVAVVLVGVVLLGEKLTILQATGIIIILFAAMISLAIKSTEEVVVEPLD